ncbi:MAG: LacI family DNA-binding transcriptional regulator [Actinomycetaceae bacterium]|nr:LacI family DNA-binding transcriptional regulator [Actinomycetaceae bacterium]
MTKNEGGAGPENAEDEAAEGGDPAEKDATRRVTIYDVAREAGVAASTVSRTFARPGRVNAETAEKIRAVAEALGYRTSSIPRAMRDEATKVLAFIAADVTNPVYGHMMRAFQNEALAGGYTTILLDSQEDSLREQQLIQQIIPLVDGLALVASRLSDSAISQVAKVIPVVVVNRAVAGITSVVPDTMGGVRKAVEYLHSLGHMRLTYLSGPSASWIDGMRWRAATDICTSQGIHLRRVGPNIPTLRGGVAATQLWKDHPTSAVLAYNDIMAIGFIKGAQSLGLRVPGDVSVIGIDNSMASILTTPTLTSVATKSGDIGQRAAKTLIHHISHRSEKLAPTITVPTGIITRESTGNPTGAISTDLLPDIH